MHQLYDGIIITIQLYCTKQILNVISQCHHLNRTFS